MANCAALTIGYHGMTHAPVAAIGARIPISQILPQLTELRNAIIELRESLEGNPTAEGRGSDAAIRPSANDLPVEDTGEQDERALARALRTVQSRRNQRARLLGAGLFADPAWDMLIDLAAARIEGRDISIGSLCLASGVPVTTALRWVAALEQAELIVRESDTKDRRRTLVRLTPRAIAAIHAYFADDGAEPSRALHLA